MDFQAFVDGEKTLLVAPAGYGKTHTIVESIKFTAGCQLILTHTHAGVASIKEKIKKANISTDRYSVETISSFAQKYVNSFYMGTDIPNQDDPHNYHPFILKEAEILFKSTIIKIVIKSTYSGLFVDEYQDCTKSQHQMIMALSESLKTHILGDPLQGIFDFNGDLVDFVTDLSGFTRIPDLSIPYRWYQDGNNKELGDLFKNTRDLLIKKESIDFSSIKVSGLYFIKIDTDDIRDSSSYYRKCLEKLIVNPENKEEFNNLLILVPEYMESREGESISRGNIDHRAQIRAIIDYGKRLTLIEAIDDKSFYSIAKNIDDLCSCVNRLCEEPIKQIKEKVLKKLFQKTEIDIWFNESDVINKREEIQRGKAEQLRQIIQEFLSHPTSRNMQNLIIELKNELKLKYNREGLLFSLLNALSQSDVDDITVYEAMVNQRNFIRRMGRKMNSKCIGTTLLTKGLEFDTVAILDADKFNSPKHFYVAITRCCKNLVIFSSKNILNPYK